MSFQADTIALRASCSDLKQASKAFGSADLSPIVSTAALAEARQRFCRSISGIPSLATAAKVVAATRAAEKIAVDLKAMGATPIRHREMSAILAGSRPAGI